MIAVFRREWKALFCHAHGYIVTGIFLLFACLFVTLVHFVYGYADFTQTISYLTVGTALVLPVLSMALFAPSDKEHGTALLRALPLSGKDIIWGKYLTALLMLGCMTLFLAIVPLILCLFGEIRLVLAYAGLLAFFCMEHALLSVCMYIASAVPNRLAAWLIGYGTLGVLWTVGRLAEFLPQPLQQLANALSVFGMYTPFVFGFLDWRTLILCAVISLLFLMLTVHGEQKKWIR